MGVVPLLRALQIAQEHGFDLVAVSPTTVPPVCRLLDYGRYKYEQTKKERKQKKSLKVGLLKEVRLRPKIEEHDLQAKIRTVRKLLEEGSKIRLVVRFRGREVIYPESGWRVLRRVSDALKEVAVVSDHPARDARNIALTLSPLPTKGVKETKKNAETQDS